MSLTLRNRNQKTNRVVSLPKENQNEGSEQSQPKKRTQRPLDDKIMLNYFGLSSQGMHTTYLKHGPDNGQVEHYTATGILVPSPPPVVSRSIRSFFCYSEVDLHRINTGMMSGISLSFDM